MKDIIKNTTDKQKIAWLSRLMHARIKQKTTDKEFFEIIVPEKDKIPEEINVLEEGMRGFYDPDYLLYFYSGIKDDKRVAIQGLVEREDWEEKNGLKAIKCREFLIFNKQGKYRRFYLPENNLE